MSAHDDKRTPSFTLVLPLYNEGQKLKKNLHRIKDVLDHASFSYEIILIDDASKDSSGETGKVFAELFSNVLYFTHEKNIGRGGTVREGIERGRGEIVGFMDVDCEIAPVYILEFVPKLLGTQLDIITGYRIYRFSLSSILRSFSSVVYRLLLRRMLHLPLGDTESGYKFFKRSKLMPVLDKTKNTGWFWDTEIMARSVRAGLRIQEDPVLFIRDKEKQSTVKLLRDSYDYFFALLRLKKEFERENKSI